jgi:prophage regulatory protein
MLKDDINGAHHCADPQPQPNLTSRLPSSGFLRLRQVLQIVPISRSTLYQKLKLGTFPSAIKLGPRMSAWRTEDIQNYIRDPR